MTTPALFLDRDGVINVDHGYVHLPEQVAFVPGIFELVRAANLRGWPAVVVTNQAGIGRGLYSEDDFHAFTAWLHARFAERGAPLARTYFCPSHPVHGIGRYQVDSPDRKPAPGMILRARDELALDLPRSVLVGDKASDAEAGIAAGVGLNLLLAPARLPGAETVHDLFDAAARLPA